MYLRRRGHQLAGRQSSGPLRLSARAEDVRLRPGGGAGAVVHRTGRAEPLARLRPAAGPVLPTRVALMVAGVW